MKTFSFTSIAVLLTLGLVLLSSPLLADVDTHDGVTTSGTIPFAASWELTEDNNTTALPGVNIAAYDADFITIADLIAIGDFDCNTKFKITAARGNWTVPANYDTSAGNKKENINDSDLLLMVDNITAGYASDGLAALGSYGSYTAIVIEGSDIIGGGAVGVDAGHGVENAVCDVNAKILMDWPTDIVGAYSIDVTLTITEVTE